MASAGSIALIAFGADGASGSADPFSFVLLDTTLRGQTIYITDNGVQADGTFRTGEGVASFTIPTDAAIGSVYSRASFTNVTGSYDGSGSGDSVIAYLGSATVATTFLFAIDYADGNTTYSTGATNTNTTAVPPGLTFGQTALAFALDNGVYSGPTSGTADQIRGFIADPANWTTSDTVAASYAGGAFTVGGAGTTQVSIDDVTIAEGDAGTSVLTFTVTRSDANSAFSVDYASGGGTATAGSDYETVGGTLTFAANGALTQTISVTINGDTVVEPSETFTVTLSNLVQTTGATAISDATGTGTIQNDDVSIIYIHDVQGSAFFSPILAGDGITAYNQASTTEVTVRGVVTAIDTQGTVQGFYISEETSDWDDNALTSEGIYVKTTGATSGLTVGETVTVTAKVTEYQDFTNLPRTMLTNASAIVQSNDSVSLPTFIIDGSVGHRIPTAIISDDNPNFRDSTGASGTFDPQNDALDFYETIEGMRVTLTNVIVGDGFVGGSNDNFVYFSAYSADNADPTLINSRGGYTIFGDPEFYPVDTSDPNDDVQYGGRTTTDGAQHGDIVELDFGNVGRGGTADFDQLLTMGDSLGDVTGILDSDFGTIKLYVTDALDPAKIAGLGTTPVQEVTELTADPRSLRIATFNVENLSPVGTTFSTNNGVEITTQEKYDKLAANIANNLQSPDIIIVEEVQDNNGVGSGGTDASTTWAQLVAAVNTATGKTYQWVDEAPTTANDVGGAPGGNIRVGFLYDTARVQLGDLAADATLAERRAYTDRIGDGVRDAGDLIAIDDSQVAGINPADWSGTRRSIVGEFHFNGQTVYAFGSHLPSKGGSDNPYTLDQNNNAGNPTNGGWDDRNTLAEDIWAVQNLATTTVANARVVSGGDFNEFWFNRPLEVLTGYANADGTANTTGSRYVNLVVQELSPAERFSYDFNGRSQTLDTILTDQVTAGVASYDVVHINTGYNERTGAVNPASSDHDPALASFDFREFAETLTGGANADILFGFGGDDTIVGDGGDDILSGGLGDDVLNGGANIDRVTYAAATSGVTVSLAETGPQDTGDGMDTLIGIEQLGGSAFADVLTGSIGANTIVSNGGADEIRGLNGADSIIVTGSTALIDGGDGSDTLTISGIFGGMTDATLTDIEKVLVRADAIVDLSGVATSVGTIRVSPPLAGGASIIGTDDAEQIVGGAGADTLGGGLGADTVGGGGGIDTFLFRDLDEIATVGRDRIRDFSHADGDRIDLSSVDARDDIAGVQSLTYIGDAAFTGAGGTDYELRIKAGVDGRSFVQIDVNHDGAADRTFIVVSDAALNEGDFILAPLSSSAAPLSQSFAAAFATAPAAFAPMDYGIAGSSLMEPNLHVNLV